MNMYLGRDVRGRIRGIAALVRDDVCARGARFRVLFFFQAEDGIRDLTVTGVQTCALPIWQRSGLGAGSGERISAIGLANSGSRREQRAPCGTGRVQLRRAGNSSLPLPAFREIGRASCRERV